MKTLVCLQCGDMNLLNVTLSSVWVFVNCFYTPI